MKILVTGGAGFIGSALVRALAGRCEVRVLDDLSTGNRGNLDGVDCDFFFGSCENCHDLPEVLRGVDLVVHLASSSDIRTALENPMLDFRRGAEPTAVLLAAMKRAGVRRIVFASSSTVYGLCHGRTLSQREELLYSLPISLYGAQKLYSEAMLSAYAECFDFRAIALRFGSVVGSERRTGIIWDFLTSLRDKQRIDVLGDGRQIKPYIHVDDCVRGIVRAIEECDEEPGGDFRAMNLAAAGTVEIGQIARWCRAHSPYPNAPIAYGAESGGWRGDVPACNLSTERFARWGFRANLSPEMAVQRVIKEQADELWPAKVERSAVAKMAWESGQYQPFESMKGER